MLYVNIFVTNGLKLHFHVVFCDPDDPNRAKQEAVYVYFVDSMH